MAASESARNLTRVAAQAADAKFGTDIVAFDVSDRLAFTDVFLIVTAANERQVSGVVDAVEEALHHEGARVLRREGERQARWVLLDFGDLIVHVQHADERQVFALERLWRDCPRIELALAAAPGPNLSA